MVKLNRRDITPPDPQARQSDIARGVAEVIGSRKPVDLSPLEREVQESRKLIGELQNDIAQLRLALASRPRPIYDFEMTTGEDGLISGITAVPRMVN